MVLGFNVREPDAGRTIFCIHSITKEELWIPKTSDGVLEDVLVHLFRPIQLGIVYFRSVYLHMDDMNLFPSDQL